MKIIPVLHDDFTSPVSLVDVYISTIKDKRSSSAIMKELAKALPMLELKHLKRIRSVKVSGKIEKLQIILCTKDRLSQICEAVCINELAKALSIDMSALDDIYLAKAASKAPLTRQQYELANQHWPVYFYEDKLFKKLREGTFFSCDEITCIEQHMEQIHTLIKGFSCGNNQSKVPCAAIIIDPHSNTELAQTILHNQEDNAMKHAVMEVIDIVAKEQVRYYKRSKSSIVSKEGPYLCTNYDLYTNLEPCVSCAMALVHSRIRRVFYTDPQADGALGSMYKLHTLPSLNHHYQVFRTEFEVES